MSCEVSSLVPEIGFIQFGLESAAPVRSNLNHLRSQYNTMTLI
jgi:hypothetical protein